MSSPEDVTTTTAQVSDEVVSRHRGIRYARAVRFKPPVDVDADHPVDELGHPSPACPQVRDPGDAPLGDLYAGMAFEEDCHRLSVTSPADMAAGERLPVMVWIHGGSYVTGGGDLPIYDPALLVAEQRVVVVSVTYRLGMLGYLGDPDEGRAANLGLLDQLSALRWVQRHISSYGGDPETVTVFGQSSGGDAVAHLLASTGARGLFRRAVVQSAPLSLRRHKTRMIAAMLRAGGPLDATTPLPDVLAAQRRAQRSARWSGLRAGMPFGVQYGRAPLPAEAEMERRWQDEARRVDVMVGTTAEETTYFIHGWRVFRLPVLGKHIRSAVVGFSTWLVYGRDSQRFAHTLSSSGGRVVGYRLTWCPAGSDLGATHIMELPLLFESAAWDGAPVLGSASAEQIRYAGENVRRVWADFARTGDPTPDADPNILRLVPQPTKRHGFRLRRLILDR